MITAGIIGGAGYTGGETMRLLLHHPHVDLRFVQSGSHAGKHVADVHRDCYGQTDLRFSIKAEENVDVLFLCKGHGESRKYIVENGISSSTRIIDLSQDFRHGGKNILGEKKFIYGLPELHREHIRTSSHVANPGCFATCIQLSLLPLAAAQQIRSDIGVSATTGSTGAGQGFSGTTHYSWRNNNHGAYKIFNHQHEEEIRSSISSLQVFDYDINFIPQRGAFTRGIYCVSYLSGDYDLETVRRQYEDYYKDHPFVHIVPFDVDVKQVLNTNNCYISLSVVKNKLILTAAIDNLLKGASGQAVQNMNLLFGFGETSGLKLKPTAY
jgi:N-acetyl-gamma-glutamyl-phosphate reductase